MAYAILLAGGIGRRTGLDIPKQFFQIKNKPFLAYCIDKFVPIKEFEKIVVSSPKEYIHETEEIIDKFFPDEDRLVVIEGGETRNDTIFKIIDEIKRDFGENDDDIIVTHDAVRPFVTLRILEENIDAAVEFGACDTVVPATDTIVCSEDGEEISDIPNRELMYQGQTPQSFKVKMLKELYAQLTDTEKDPHAVSQRAGPSCVPRHPSGRRGSALASTG
jgi:2-C-methyl-D-erythritol 4-phosphate cytidylyltransferase